MHINPNDAFREAPGNRPMNEGQRVIIEQLCKEHDISLIRLTTRALGVRKKTKDLTRIDATRCIMMGSVWENYKRAGYEK